MEPAVRILLVRQGETDWSRLQRFRVSLTCHSTKWGWLRQKPWDSPFAQSVSVPYTPVP